MVPLHYCLGSKDPVTKITKQNKIPGPGKHLPVVVVEDREMDNQQP